jgi:hypothetical protein
VRQKVSYGSSVVEVALNIALNVVADVKVPFRRIGAFVGAHAG